MLAQYIPLINGLVETFDPFCEIALHDLEKPENSLIYLNGSITGRKIGSPITDLVLKEFKKYGDAVHDIIGYGVATKDGKQFKSSTIFIRDENEKVVGCFCINFEITHFSLAKGMLEKLCSTKEKQVNEYFALDISETIERIISETIETTGKPAKLMTKEEKIKVISNLDEKGVFLVKGAVDDAGRALAVSKYTIYNYIEEARANQKNVNITPWRNHQIS